MTARLWQLPFMHVEVAEHWFGLDFEKWRQTCFQCKSRFRKIKDWKKKTKPLKLIWIFFIIFFVFHVKLCFNSKFENYSLFLFEFTDDYAAINKSTKSKINHQQIHSKLLSSCTDKIMSRFRNDEINTIAYLSLSTTSGKTAYTTI